MPTYVYETIPQIPGIEPRRFEMRQSMKDPALTIDPVTGEPVRRVISGGFGFVAQKTTGGSSPTSTASSASACGQRCACCR